MTDLAGPPTREMMLAHTKFVRGLTGRLLRDEHDAEDLAQDVLAEAIEKPPRHSANVRGWLSRVARNLALMRARSRGRRLRREWTSAREEACDPTVEIVARLEVQRDVVRAVLSLAEPYRSTIYLRFYDGLTPRAIARRQDVSVSTVYTRIRRALALLRERLDSRHGGRRAWMTTLGTGVIVSAKTKAALAAVLLVALVGAGWVVRPKSPPRPPAKTTADARPELTLDSQSEQQAPADRAADDAPDEAWDLYVEVVGPDGKHANGLVRCTFLSDRGERIATGSPNPNGRVHLAARGTGSLVLDSFISGPAPKRIDGLSPPESGRHDLLVRLETGLAIEGLLLDQNGEMVPGARVVARLIDPPAWIGDFERRAGGARTPAEYRANAGRFRVEGLLPGRYRLEPQVHRTDVGTAGVLPRPAVEAAAGERGVVIRLAPSALVTLRLLDAETGEPLGVPAEVSRVAAHGEESIWSRAPSEVRLKLRVGETWRLVARALGYAASEPQEIQIDTAGSERSVEIPLAPDPGATARLTLLVRDDSGRPVEGARLSRMPAIGVAIEVGSAPGGLERLPGGRLAIELMPGVHRFQVSSSKRHGELLRGEAFEVDLGRGESIEREVVLRRGGSLRLIHPPGYRSGIYVKTPDGGHVSGTGIKMLPEGGRVFTGIPPGDVVVFARRPDGRWAEHAAEVRAGETTDVILDVAADPPERKSADPGSWEK